jgi:hypothetical protein
MNYSRRNAGVVAHNGMLFVIGGDDGTSNLASVEVILTQINRSHKTVGTKVFLTIFV